eukprot:2106989-Amphidinium_carterae.1
MQRQPPAQQCSIHFFPFAHGRALSQKGVLACGSCADFGLSAAVPTDSPLRIQKKTECKRDGK